MFEDYTVFQKAERENVIYGAGAFGKKLLRFFKDLDVTVHFFCQTEIDSEAIKIDGIPVISIDELKRHQADKNIFLALYNKEVSKQLKRMLQSFFFESAHIYDCGDFIYNNLRQTEGKHYCLVCGSSFDKYESGGENFDLFKRYHIAGGGFRKNYRCPCCDALDRERWIYKLLSEKTGIYIEPCRVLHFAPEAHIRDRIKQNQQCDYYSADIETGRAEHVIDMTNIPFQDDTFDYIIVNHVLEHIRQEEKALLELKRTLKKDGKLILSFPICKDKKTEEDLTDLSEQERVLKFGQNDHIRLYGTDYKERLESHGFQCSCYSPEDNLSAEQIEKYGLIEDDVCIICKK